MKIFNCTVLAMIRFYQRYVSCIKPRCCRFVPTCSEYARQAFEKHNAFYAILLTIWRILRCNPFYRGSLYDPVPEPRGQVVRK